MADKFYEYLDMFRVHILHLLDLDPCVSKFSKKAQDITGVPREYLAVGLLVFKALWLTYGVGAALISTLVGVLYPAYMSVKAIDSPRHSDDTEWLMYWVIFGIVTILECLIELVDIFPIYYLSKCIFLIWCFLPINNNGSKLIYYHVVRHIVKKHEKRIDAAAKKFENQFKNAKDMLDTVKDLSQDVQTMSSQVLSSVEEQHTQTSVRNVEVRRMVQKVHHTVESHVEGKFQIVDPTEIEEFEQIEPKQ